MKASKATIGPTAAGTRTYVSYQQGHCGQPQGLTSMCDMWYKGKRMGKSTKFNQQKPYWQYARQRQDSNSGLGFQLRLLGCKQLVSILSDRMIMKLQFANQCSESVESEQIPKCSACKML